VIVGSVEDACFLEPFCHDSADMPSKVTVTGGAIAGGAITANGWGTAAGTVILSGGDIIVAGAAACGIYYLLRKRRENPKPTPALSDGINAFTIAQL
jgi:hypothetical protein